MAGKIGAPAVKIVWLNPRRAATAQGCAHSGWPQAWQRSCNHRARSQPTRCHSGHRSACQAQGRQYARHSRPPPGRRLTRTRPMSSSCRGVMPPHPFSPRRSGPCDRRRAPGRCYHLVCSHGFGLSPHRLWSLRYAVRTTVARTWQRRTRGVPPSHRPLINGVYAGWCPSVAALGRCMVGEDPRCRCGGRGPRASSARAPGERPPDRRGGIGFDL